MDRTGPTASTVLAGVIGSPVRHSLSPVIHNAAFRAMGIDLGSARLDTTTHPFCEGFAPGDTRLTTRYRDERFTDALYGTMHEGGHGLYEQGLPKGEHDGEPLAQAIGLGMHESQSRMSSIMVSRLGRNI